MEELIKRFSRMSGAVVETHDMNGKPSGQYVLSTDHDAALEANAALIALLRASLRKVEGEVEAMKSDVSIKAALIAWFDPNHPDQGDFAARMRKAIDAAMANKKEGE